MKNRRISFLGQDSVVVIIIVFFTITFIKNFLIDANGQFVFLADSFLHGKLYFLEEPGKWLDTVKHQGKYFWPLGPFPALALIPFVAIFGKGFQQGYLMFFLNLAIFYLIYQLTRFFKFKKVDSLWLSFAFIFASVYAFSALVPYSWYFIHVITTFLYFLAIREYFGRKRLFLIGLYFAAILMTRFTAGLGIIFFGLTLLVDQQKSLRNKLAGAFFLFLPMILAGFLLLGYNYARFGNPLDNGYWRANEFLLTEDFRYKLISNGLFKLKNIPTNIYYYFLKSLDPVRLDKETMHGQTFLLKKPYVEVGFPGVSFFILSPFFLYFFKSDFKKKLVKMMLVPIAIIQFILLTYYWPGWLQMGPRYMLDFLPLAFLVVLFAFKKRRLAIGHKLLIFSSACLNLYLFLNMRVNF